MITLIVENPSFSISFSSLIDSWNNRGLTCNNGWGEARPSLAEEAAILDKCKILLQLCILVSLYSIHLKFILFKKNSCRVNKFICSGLHLCSLRNEGTHLSKGTNNLKLNGTHHIIPISWIVFYALSHCVVCSSS